MKTRRQAYLLGLFFINPLGVPHPRQGKRVSGNFIGDSQCQ